MLTYNLTEYSNNYSDSSGRLWKFKRDEQNMNNGNIPVGVHSTIQQLLNTNQVP